MFPYGMVASAPSRVLALRGKLVRDPTDLSAPYPHGGVALGTVRDVEWRPQRRYFRLEAEEYGTAIESIFLGESGVLACIARGFDSDFLRQTFSPTLTGAATGRASFYGNVRQEATRAGRREGAELASRLYLSPDTDHDHGIILYRAVPLVDEAARINYKLREDIGLLCLFLATPDRTGMAYHVAPRSDIVL